MIGILLLMFGPAVLFLILALYYAFKNNKKMTKLFFILTGVYLLISLGVCGIVLANISLH